MCELLEEAGTAPLGLMSHPGKARSSQASYVHKHVLQISVRGAGSHAAAMTSGDSYTCAARLSVAVNGCLVERLAS